MDPEKQYTKAEQELTYTLVTELLAHQFCSPVQWIDTQEAILRHFATERVVEIGPSETLANMMRKTIKGGFVTQDMALGLQREILSYEKDSDSIYYTIQGGDEPQAPASTQTNESATDRTQVIEPVATVTVAKTTVATTVRAEIPDTPINPVDTITVLMALALKKPAEGINRAQTIKALCGGRSTVQNEIIGDLTKEFGSLPDQPEDMTPEDLGSAISDFSVGKKLGPCTSALMGKVCSTKMPASTNVSSLRAYLESRWGLRQGLQDHMFLYTISSPPDARLATEKDVRDFMDGIVAQEFKKLNVDLTSYAAGESQASAGGGVVSSEALDGLRRELQKDDQKLLEVYAERVSHDLHGAGREKEASKAVADELQARNDAWGREHGDAYERGIAPHFDARKVRKYDSYWNWAVQDLVALFSASMADPSLKLETKQEEMLARLPTRVTPQLLGIFRSLLNRLPVVAADPRVAATRDWLTAAQWACEMASATAQPFFKHSACSMIPVLRIDDRGTISVDEKMRSFRYSAATVPEPPSVRQAARGASETDSVSYQTVGTSIVAIGHVGQGADEAPPLREPNLGWTPRLQTKGRNGWQQNDAITNDYLQWFQRAATGGISFSEKQILITGAGKNSIGSEMVSLCLAAGAKVLVTTSSYSKATCDYYQSLYRHHGARNSQLVVAPFNGGSRQDVAALVNYVYGELGWDLDHVIPFAALGEAGRAIDGIDDRSELSHRIMLTNLVRLLGAVKAAKAQRSIVTHPTQVLLPLSPNHGIFGQDGLYAESKIGLEVLLNKWWSEDWADYLALCGVVIGWTRGTGLMSSNDVLAAGIERSLGIRTFSAPEMAWHIVGLMDESVAPFCHVEPLLADLTGGLGLDSQLKPTLNQIQKEIRSKSEMRKAIAKEQELHEAETGAAAVKAGRPRLPKKARIQVDSVALPGWDEIRPLNESLQGMVDLERVVVAVGFGEIGPYGSARTRWEAECSGTFSVDGCLELAWVMGLIKFHNGPLRGTPYCGWVDVESGAAIADAEVKAKHEKRILENSGIRLVVRQTHDLAAPDQEQILHEVAVTADLEPFEVSEQTAEDFRREHGDKVATAEGPDGQILLTIRAGATLHIPKAVQVPSFIGAQMPTGFDARTYGVPDDVVAQVDPITLHLLIAAAEAFLAAGLADPWELYAHMPVSALGNTVGASLGGARSLHAMFKKRLLDRGRVQADVLAETFVNTPAAWLNMLLLGAAGPLRTPVGACATALESVDAGYDLIAGGRARAVLVGGTDGLERDTAAEFARMTATIDGAQELVRGRAPGEASRPATSTRAGFVEAEGAGVQLLTTARLALDLGLPVRAVVALTHTAADGIERSVPAPGQGLLTIAAEQPPPPGAAGAVSAGLSLEARRSRLTDRLREIEAKRIADLRSLGDVVAAVNASRKARDAAAAGSSPAAHNDEGSVAQRLRDIETHARRSIRNAKNTYGNDFWRHEPSVSPLRGALAVWGLTIDDLDVASLHGTSTVKNDKNEAAVIQTQLRHLGRTEGNVVPCVLQKSHVGHGKGAAGAFAVNSCLQMMATSTIPGNRNADNIDPVLRQNTHLFFPSETYRAPTPIKAFSVTSFGFGQKGAQVIGVNPRYLFATLSEAEYAAYKAKVAPRMARVDQMLMDGICGGSLVKVKATDFNKETDGWTKEKELLKRI